MGSINGIDPINYYEMYKGLGNGIAQAGSDLGTATNTILKHLEDKDAIKNMETDVSARSGQAFSFPKGTSKQQALDMYSKWGYQQHMYQAACQEAEQEATNLGLPASKTPRIMNVVSNPVEAYMTKDEDYKKILDGAVANWRDKDYLPQVNKMVGGIPGEQQPGQGPLSPSSTLISIKSTLGNSFCISAIDVLFFR